MFKKMNKKAEMAIGTLIIFIAMVLVAAIAAGVVLQTATALQNKALLTGERTRAQIGTGLQPLLVYGEDGSDRYLEAFYIKLKLAPGSDALNFDDMLLAIDTNTASQASIHGEHIKNLNDSNVEDDDGWRELDPTKVDFNNNNRPDYMRLYNETHVQFNLSNASKSFEDDSYFTLFGEIEFEEEDVTLADATATDPVEINTFSGKIVDDSSNQYGTFHITGESTSPTHFTEEVFMVVGDGTSSEQGAYAVDYLSRGNTFMDGYLQTGDVVKIGLVAPHELGEDERLDIRFVPKTGTPRTLNIVVPDLVNTQRVYMYQ
ncbi:MAG: archaellin/type IV pilin N-terminal domain-containing protein [Candidatus Woesearchaeota archaeon]